jgi:hypothetical protein
VYNELDMMNQGLKMSQIVKKFQTVKMVFNSGAFFRRDTAFTVF